MGLHNPQTNVETTTIMQNAAGADGNGTSLALTPNTKDVTLIVTGITGALTVNVEISRDGGATWIVGVIQDSLALSVSLVSTVVDPTTTTIYHYLHKPGFNLMRARISSFLSGSVTVTAIKREMVF